MGRSVEAYFLGRRKSLRWARGVARGPPRAFSKPTYHGAYGLGATHSQTIKQVVIPAALPGIVGGILLAVSRGPSARP